MTGGAWEGQISNQGDWLGTQISTPDSNAWGMSVWWNNTQRAQRFFGTALTATNTFETRFKYNRNSPADAGGFSIKLLDAATNNVVDMWVFDDTFNGWNPGAGSSVDSGVSCIDNQEYLYRVSMPNATDTTVAIYAHVGGGMLSNVWTTTLTGASLTNVLGMAVTVTDVGDDGSEDKILWNKAYVYSGEGPDYYGAFETNSRVWKSSAAGGLQVVRQADIELKTGGGTNSYQLLIQPYKQYQAMVGFGASMTEASSVLIANSPDRDQIMEELFDPEDGIGISLVRIPMGACDFSTNLWSYEDVPGQFTIARDLQNTIPLLKQALALNPDLQFMGSPWSAPAWMKTTGSMLGGGLNEEYLDEYAQYFVDFILAYEAEGLPIWSITVQNEPLHCSTTMPTMLMSGWLSGIFVEKLGQVFDANGIDTKIIVYDHNYGSGVEYLNTLYANAAAYSYIEGSAWHAYAGEADSMGEISRAYPDKGVFFTERTGETTESYPSKFHYFMQTIFHAAAINGAKTLMAWNIALEDGCPRLPSVWWDAGAGLLNFAGGSYQFDAEYAAVGHYAKGVRPGAVRLGVMESGGLDAVAFINPDGTVAAVVFNGTGSRRTFDVAYENRHCSFTLGAGEAATFRFATLRVAQQ